MAVANCSTVDGGEKKNIKRHLFSGGHHGGGIIGHQGVASYSGSHGYSSGYSSGYNGIYEGASYIKPEIHTVIKQKVPFPVPVDRPVPFPVAGENSTDISNSTLLLTPKDKESRQEMKPEREKSDKYMEIAIRLMLELILFLM